MADPLLPLAMKAGVPTALAVPLRSTNYATGAGTSAIGSTYTTLVSLAVTIVNTTDNVVITVGSGWQASAATVSVDFQIEVDSTSEVVDQDYSHTVGSVQYYNRTIVVTGLSAGSHTIKLQLKANSGTVSTGTQVSGYTVGVDNITALVTSV